jgi:hypothetical protein
MSTQTFESESAQMATPKETAMKYVYFFGGGKAEGNEKMKDVLRLGVRGDPESIHLFIPFLILRMLNTAFFISPA